LEEKMREIFTTALNIPSEKVVDTLEYKSIEEWDSAAHMILISYIEEGFDIMLDTDDVIDMSSFAKAKEIVKKYIAE
jgi:acyl carrier protein